MKFINILNIHFSSSHPLIRSGLFLWIQWRSKVSHWAQPREESRQKEGGGGGREHLFVIMVQIQTCWWVRGLPCVSWRYPRWLVPPSSISSLLAVPAHRAQTAALARRWCPGQKRNFLEVNVTVLKSELHLQPAGKPPLMPHMAHFVLEGYHICSRNGAFWNERPSSHQIKQYLSKVSSWLYFIDYQTLVS